MARSPRARCFGCRHFFVTWDARRPRGCRAMGFRCREMPERVVRTVSGTECLRYEPKPPRPGRGRPPGG